MDITKEDLKDIAKDLGQAIAEEVIRKYTEENFITGSEALDLKEIVASVSSKSISSIIGGYCPR